jgi:16S rRNA (uracil1498-N3)-methyltransferase
LAAIVVLKKGGQDTRDPKEPRLAELTSPGGRVRLFVEQALSEGARVALNAPQAHYLLHVMRARAGNRVSLFNGRDGEWLAGIAEATRRDCVLACERKTQEQTKDDDLWLVFAPIKKTPADYLAQKATELGVSVLQPVITRHTIVHRVNGERMRANAIEAAEQSGRLTVPEIRSPIDLRLLLNAWPKQRNLLFCDEGGAPPILEALTNAPKAAWAILTGPEGGFDEEERKAIRALGSSVPASLGGRILRADTAALAALAIWQAQCGKRAPELENSEPGVAALP